MVFGRETLNFVNIISSSYKMNEENVAVFRLILWLGRRINFLCKIDQLYQIDISITDPSLHCINN